MIMYGMKRGAKSLSIACFAITALLLATAQVSATTVSIADVTMESGSTITVPITIEDILYYGAGTIDLTYDPAVVGEGWQAGTSGNYYQITLTSGIEQTERTSISQIIP